MSEPPPRQSPRALVRALSVAALFAAGGVGGWLLLGERGRDGRLADRAGEEGGRGGQGVGHPVGQTAERIARRRGAAPHPRDRTGAACEPHAELRCVAGDVHSVDSCGQAEGKREECGERLCREGACAPADPIGCAALPLEGRCEGDRVRGCVGGQPYVEDCALLGKRCVTLDEGAQCRAPTELDCDRNGDLPRCEGARLLTCGDGRLRIRDCAAFGGVCGPLPDSGTIACQRIEQLDAPLDLAEPSEPPDTCLVCGCDAVADPEAAEQCNGEDDDGDGTVDEQAECEELDLVAFIITDASGNGSYTSEDVEREVERINRTFSASHHALGLEVVLADLVQIKQREWLEVDAREADAILRDPRLTAPRERPFVPVVFTDELSAGDTPKVGISTLPNGHCGGRRVADLPQPSHGGVIVAKGRSPTTTAHELGHFLGLCHTHFEHSDAPVRLVRYRTADGRELETRCDRDCLLDGDGICDTPPDPGPDACSHDRACNVRCRAGESPDPFNVMSYYTSCRHALSELQAREMRRTLKLRRAWQPCLQPGGCPCVPPTDACPEQMTCRPAVAAAFECQLDGPRLEGESCEHHVECSGGALCSGERCRRPCVTDADGCRCTPDASLGLPVCR